MTKRFIPNLFTMGNMLSGCVAAVFVLEGQIEWAVIFLGMGIFLDFFDGFFARMLGVSGKLGLELDSLADMITSGLVPGLVMMKLLGASLNNEGTELLFNVGIANQSYLGIPFLAFFGLLITLASGYRLAKFNIDERQKTSFIGLPTPANAIFILSLALIKIIYPDSFIAKWTTHPTFLIIVTLICSYLLNSSIPLFGLKFKNYKLNENWFRYLFLIVALVLLLTLKILAFPIIIIFYLVLSIILLIVRRGNSFSGN